MVRTLRYGLCGLIALSAACMMACGPSQGTRNGETGTAVSDNGGKASGAGSGDDARTGGTSNGGFMQISGAGGSDNGGVLSADAACAATVLEPETIETSETIETQVNCTSEAPTPIALYIVLDNSGSMDDNDKWPNAVDAISAFVQTDPAQGTAWTCVDSDGNSVPAPADLAPPGTGSISAAIQYFHPQNVANPDECDGSGHRTPAVAMGPLPDNANDIVASLGKTGPNGNTPTVGALIGGTEYCADYQLANPGERCVVVLVTDGQPNGCGLSSDCGGGGGNDCVDPTAASVLTPIAANAFNNSDVMTFTVGMNGVTADGFALLDAIAVAGGSDCTPGSAGNEACNVSTGGSRSLLDALNTIRQSVQLNDTSTASTTTTTTHTSTLPCEWIIPEPPPGETFDKDLVNVTLTTGGAQQTIGAVATEADCAVTGGGWYYDSPDAPSRILACPATCTVLETLTDASVQVLVGCATEPAIVR